MKQLTLKRLKNTEFIDLYNKIFQTDTLSELEIFKLLKLSIIFINQDEENLKKLGYRIIVLYSNKTNNYKPLYDISINSGLYPISKFIELKLYRSKDEHFFREFSSSFLEYFKNSDNIYLSEEQKDLNDFFDSNINNSISVVAPTSYGKSELIISLLKHDLLSNICIIVPSKALLFQTKRRIQESKIKRASKIITHPEMYLKSDKIITCVLTQERLLRLLQKNKKLFFETVVIDEAHNLLENDDRNLLLASSISIFFKRNPLVCLKYLTPFIIESENLKVKYAPIKLQEYRINEYLKTEKLFLCDFRKNSSLKLYDQFLNEFFDINHTEYKNYFELILDKKENKNLIYFNKPKDIETFSKNFIKYKKDIKSPIIEKACIELSKHLHSDYNLISCLKKGLLYHHGSIPENIRFYIEHLYKQENLIDFVVTSSTLLEGVNIPAEKLFILDNKKGNSNLSTSQFRNLVGRICRFNEVFSSSNNDLKKLEPEVYLIGSEFCSKNANLEDYITATMKIDKKVKDTPLNVLLENTPENIKETEIKKAADEFLENFENGIVEDDTIQIAQTEVGKLCFQNNITEIDILLHEDEMQRNLNEYCIKNQDLLNSPIEIFRLIYNVFLFFVKDKKQYRNLNRFQFDQTRAFYSMFLNWRIKNATFNEMITSFLKYWEKLEKEGRDTIVYVGKWGDLERGGYSKLWTDIHSKNSRQRVNLAIVRIKDEQDFLDNVLIKFIEILNDLKLLENNFYNKIKYGTSNPLKIALIKNGISLGLTNLLYDKYQDYFATEIEDSYVIFDKSILSKMRENEENEIYIYESKYNLNII